MCSFHGFYLSDINLFHFVYQAKVATILDANIHYAKLNEIFVHDLGFHETEELVVSQMADSAPLNPKIAKLIGIPHDGSQDHGPNIGGKER